MNKHVKLILSLSSMALLLCGCRGGRGGSSQTSGEPSGEPSTEPSGEPSVQPAGDYYDSIDESLTGQALVNALNQLNTQKRTSLVGYTELLSKPNSGAYVTDPGPSGGKYTITAFYSGKERKGTSGLNREHVWPNSHGGNLVEDDCHMVRPTITSENESRGNSFYVEGMNSTSEGWDPGYDKTMDATYRGDCARIIFYCAIADTRLTIIDENKHATSNANRDNKMGKLSDLLKWNLQYSVQQRENIRNSGAQSLQGNRNPFIDHPEYACRIWGNTNSTTKSICGM